MTRKALPIILLHKREVTYRDTGVSKKNEKITMTFLLLFNDLKFSKTLLFCCNGYSHAIFKFFFMNLKLKN